MLDTARGHPGPAVDQRRDLGGFTQLFCAFISHLLMQMQNSLYVRVVVNTGPSAVLGSVHRELLRTTRTAGTRVKRRRRSGHWKPETVLVMCHLRLLRQPRDDGGQGGQVGRKVGRAEVSSISPRVVLPVTMGPWVALKLSATLSSPTLGSSDAAELGVTLL